VLTLFSPALLFHYRLFLFTKEFFRLADFLPPPPFNARHSAGLFALKTRGSQAPPVFRVFSVAALLKWGDLLFFSTLDRWWWRELSFSLAFRGQPPALCSYIQWCTASPAWSHFPPKAAVTFLRCSFLGDHYLCYSPQIRHHSLNSSPKVYHCSVLLLWKCCRNMHSLHFHIIEKEICHWTDSSKRRTV